VGGRRADPGLGPLRGAVPPPRETAAPAWPRAHARAAVSHLAVAHLGLPAAVVARVVGVTPAVVRRGVLRGPDLLAARPLDADRLVAGIRRKVS
jgi:hypothetical protein